MIGILPLIIKKTRPIYNRAGQKCGNNGPGGAGNLPRGFAAGEMQPNGSKRRGFAVGDPARRSRDGDGKIPAPVGPVTARAVSRSEMEPNGDKRRVVGRGATLERSESGVGQNIGAG